MLGLYIHIPYCKSKCGYCDFYSVVKMQDKNDFISALITEIKNRIAPKQTKVDTIYFGGGTPSLLSISDFKLIFNAIRDKIDFNHVKEITIELNPDDINMDYLSQLRDLGFNRVSLGIQSFDNNVLKFMNRRHDSKQAIEAVEMMKHAGFNNISIDLIFGVKGMDTKQWADNVQKAIDLKVQHISAYHLSIEENTPFYTLLQKGKLTETPEKLSYDQYKVLVEMLEENSFNHYEISNFSLVNYESMHNSNYWNSSEYIGMGPSAHSYDGKNRRWNTADLKEYINANKNQEKFWNSELLSEADCYNEKIMLALRTQKGIDIEAILNTYSSELTNDFTKILNKEILKDNMVLNKGYASIKKDKRFLSDNIISEFFVV